ncbi:MAG: hypothetical protein H7305_02325 [Gemmatimonadaceae bacterium]|nr:hypothetical protein [Gemmatimonadaceae bacterium]
MADAAAIARYVGVLAEIEQAARVACTNDTSAADAGKSFPLPATLGEWALFGPTLLSRPNIGALLVQTSSARPREHITNHL